LTRPAAVTPPVSSRLTMPIYTPFNSFHCWIHCAITEQYEAYDEPEFKEAFKSEVLKDASELYHYVNDELMPLEFPDWDINTRMVCRAIMESVTWLDLLNDIKRDIEERDKCA